jgi:Mg2+ and Co2+ transporter CorA
MSHIASSSSFEQTQDADAMGTRIERPAGAPAPPAEKCRSVADDMTIACHENQQKLTKKLTALRVAFDMMSKTDCFDEEDIAVIAQETAATQKHLEELNATLEELNSYESRLVELDRILQDRMRVIDEIEEKTGLFRMDQDLMKKFTDKQLALTLMLRNTPVPKAFQRLASDKTQSA